MLGLPTVLGGSGYLLHNPVLYRAGKPCADVVLLQDSAEAEQRQVVHSGGAVRYEMLKKIPF